MKTTKDAYIFAKKKVLELAETGIDIIIEGSKSRFNTNIIDNYYNEKSIERRIEHWLWCRIVFKNLTKIQLQKIMELGNYLGLCGITFDCGGGIDNNNNPYRQWEFDWSFQFNKGVEDINWREARETLEDTLNNTLND